MDILRVPSLATNASVTGLSASTSYDYTITDDVDHHVIEGTSTSDSTGKLTIALPSEYDNSYTVNVNSEDYYFTVTRPYVDPTTKAETATEIAEYRKNEEMARAIIDSVIEDGFYYSKRYIETVGIGSDYIPVWKRVNKVLKLYENNVLMYDASNPDDYATAYELTADKTAIVETYADTINRLEGAQLMVPMASSDIYDVKTFYRGFPRSFDYKILVTYGYTSIPSDIQRATELLIEDISCGRLEYLNRYVTEYRTDQYQIKMSQAAFVGTGNLVVDKILSKYKQPIYTPGVF
jgi:hypothetical protein